jgi:hypothetical protein
MGVRFYAAERRDRGSRTGGTIGGADAVAEICHAGETVRWVIKW